MNVVQWIHVTSVITMLLYLELLIDIGLETWRRHRSKTQLEILSKWLVVAFIGIIFVESVARCWFWIVLGLTPVNRIVLAFDFPMIAVLILLAIVTFIMRRKRH